jgi:hypothetical protein
VVTRADLELALAARRSASLG